MLSNKRIRPTPPVKIMTVIFHNHTYSLTEVKKYMHDNFDRLDIIDTLFVDNRIMIILEDVGCLDNRNYILREFDLSVENNKSVLAIVGFIN
jgi:hypothetical protein